MNDTPNAKEPRLPPSLLLLKWLVIALLIAMIGGIVTVTSLFVTRMPDARNAAQLLPEMIRLPSGEEPVAVTIGEGWFAVVSAGSKLLIYGADGALWQEITIAAPPHAAHGSDF